MLRKVSVPDELCGHPENHQQEEANCCNDNGAVSKGASKKSDLSLRPKQEANQGAGCEEKSCVHCQMKLGESSGRPLLNCRDCGQVMHFDCYVDWCGSEPGPWDVVLCPRHKPVKRPRPKSMSDDPRVAVLLGQPKTCTPAPSGQQEQIRGTQYAAKANLAQVGHARKGSGDGKRLGSQSSANSSDDALSCLTVTPTHPKRPLTPDRSPSSPAASHSSSDATHHSPMADRRERMEPPCKTLKIHAETAHAKLNDEELAMELHRQLNAPTRRRRGEP